MKGLSSNNFIHNPPPQNKSGIYQTHTCSPLVFDGAVASVDGAVGVDGVAVGRGEADRPP